MTRCLLRIPHVTALCAALAACSAPDCREFPPPDSHAAVATESHERIHTNRDGKQLLRLPKEDDAFGFVVFGDRTGGPKEGIEVLKQAVRDTNLLDPDLVFTVGDLVNGYNDQPAWLEQADEYKGAMAQLRMPWFPVAGNHDIYWRGKDKPQGEHEKDFETHFGPLWYALEHKNCLFVSLYSDEGDPATGKKDFTDPKCQRMSDAQFAWLQATLAQHRDKRHVFVFLHHPRWLEARYPGADWERVHRALVEAKNVTAVFGGHIHRMRFDGVRDGIQYFTIASVGAFLDLDLPRVGFLHEFHVVTVRDEGIQLAALPVGTVMDPRAITGAMSDDVEALHTKLAPRDARGLRFDADGSAVGEITVDFDNPASQPIELTLLPEGDETWSFGQDHAHAQIAAGGRATVKIAARRSASTQTLSMPSVVMRVDYLAGCLRIALPPRTMRCDCRTGRSPWRPSCALPSGRAACRSSPRHSRANSASARTMASSASTSGSAAPTSARRPASPRYRRARGITSRASSTARRSASTSTASS
jgi:Calcineurin-like phosphoesterase